MKLNISLLRAAVLALLAVSTISAVAIFKRVVPAQIAPRTAAQARESYGKLPLSFEENRGQANESVDFVARGPRYALNVAPTEAAFVLSKASSDSAMNAASSKTVRMNLVGANRAARAAGQNELEGRVNYFIGNDPSKWRTEVPTFGRVRYAEVYPGIDVVYYGNQRRLEYDFVVGPGRDPQAIGLEFTGADKLEVEGATGDLLIAVGGENIRQHKPVVYQEINGQRREIEGRYALRTGGRVGFDVRSYDRSAPLIIDPVLEYSTYLGGNGEDHGTCIAVDSSGNAYVAGYTDSTNFPVANAAQGAKAAFSDVFVTKLNATGTAVVYSTYIGGSGTEGCLGIALDSSGNAYLTGFTNSSNFPTVNAVQNASGAAPDAFVTKLNAAGSALVYSTYLGGNRRDNGTGIAVDSAGNAYVTGVTESTNFPMANALQSAFAGPSEAFITKFNAAGSALVYSTYLGGIGQDQGSGIAVDSNGNVYVTGFTYATNFPTANAIQPVSGGDQDAFVTKINAAGSALVYSTYLGGTGVDFGGSIAVDSAGNAYVTGTTFSANFPKANALQGSLGGDSDAFVTKINANGSALVYSTYLGGNGFDGGSGIAVDSTGNAYVTGGTISTNFPTVNAFQSTIGQANFDDAFVAKVNAAGSALVYSTYLGGPDTDDGFGIALDSAGNAYVTGTTASRCFPTTTGAFDTTFNRGLWDGFITKLSETAQPKALAPCPSQLLNISSRARVLPGDGALIGGFIITGNNNAAKRVIIRGIGPSLSAFGVQGPLANPTLELYDSFIQNPPLRTNDDWITNRAEVEATGIPPSNDLESAIVYSTSPGAFTTILRGKDNGSGIGVVEVYDLNSDANAILANISSRAFVDAGDSGWLIGGFIIGGSGTGPTRVVVRGIGPSLRAFGVSAPLEDPTLELRNANGTILKSNNDWQQSTDATEISSRGLAPADSHESALVISLIKGDYTAIVRGVNGGTGIGVVDVYDVE